MYGYAEELRGGTGQRQRVSYIRWIPKQFVVSLV